MLLVRWTFVLVVVAAVAVSSHIPGRAESKRLHIIGAGFPRTGTTSTKKALELLGYKVLHIEDLVRNGLGRPFLRALTNDEAMDQLFEHVLDLGFNATLDGPMNLLTFEMLKRYPDAKVLFGERDSVEQWADSMALIYTLFGSFLVRPLKWFVDADFALMASQKYSKVHRHRYRACVPTVWTRLMPWWECQELDVSRDEFVAYYNEHKERVKRAVPADQLLFFNVRQGWTPLVEFLGTSAPPNTPFPNLKDSNEIKVYLALASIVVKTWPLIGLALVAVFTVAFRKVTDVCFK